jgi:hypothetical protein
MAKRNKKISAEDSDLLELALKRFKDCETANRDVYDAALNDLKFCVDQWPDELRRTRSTPGQERPIVTDDRISAVVHKICNDQRQNRAQGKVRPLSDATQSKADLYTGIIRHIQYDSDSETAFDTSFESAVRCSIGYHRIATDYVDDQTFDEEIKIKRISNPFTVFFPIHLCRELDFSDAEYCFAWRDIPKDEFEEDYPGFPIADWLVTRNGSSGWLTEKTVRVCEYFYIEHEKKTLYKFSDGTTAFEIPEGFLSVDEREVDKRSVKWCLLTQGAVLDKGDFPGQWLPIIPVLGEEINVEGQVVLKSAIRNCKDPQRMVNYYSAQEMEIVALAPKAPHIAAEHQLDGYEDQWAAANIQNIAVLKYKPIMVGGTVLPPPQRSQPPMVSTAIVEAKREYIDSIKATSGVFDASLGAQGNEKSGVAIRARQRQGDTANFHFPDNLAKSMCHTWRVVVAMIPEVYDTEREITIMGEDMRDEIVRINSELEGDVEGKKHFGHLDAGRYGVVVDTGPSYASKRQEVADNLIQMGQNDPNIYPIARDLIAKNVGMGADVVERFAKTIDPKLMENKDQQSVPVAQVQAMQQEFQAKEKDLQGVIEQAMADIQKLEAAVKEKQSGFAKDIAVTQMKTQAELEKAHLDNAHEIGMAAHSHVLENNPQIAEIINDLSSRLMELESSIKTMSQAPAANAESTAKGATNANGTETV